MSPQPSDTQGKFKAQKFACKQRGALLTLLYQCVYLARQSLKLPVAPKLLGYGTGHMLPPVLEKAAAAHAALIPAASA